jgi:hypothetical protein
MYTFAHGPWKGQAYPMWNWSVRFRGVRVEGE